MVKFYVMMMEKGRITFKDVPRKLKEPVKEYCLANGKEYLIIEE